MIIVGEQLSTSRPRVTEAVAKRDAQFIINVARAQVEAGARYIDINAGTFLEHEVAYLCWMVETIQNELNVPLCLGSLSPQALSEAMKCHKGEPMINSISLEPERFQALLPLVTSQPCQVVALCSKQASESPSAEERIRCASDLITKLTREGIPVEKIYVDPIVQPLAVNSDNGKAALMTIERIMNDFPGVNTICGPSNISFGLPSRGFINRSFMALAAAAGLSAAILDPTDKKLMATLLSVEMLLGRDGSCENFIDAFQNGRIAQ